MRTRGAVLIGALLIVGGLVALLAPRWLARPSDEEQIRAAVARFERGLETGDVRDCLAIISRRFHGQELTQPDVARGLWQLTRETSQVTFFVDALEVRVAPDGRTARIVAHVAFLGSGSMGEWSFGQDRPVRVEATFEKEGRDWRAVSCQGFPTVPSWY